jgi:hypothetical protein
MHVDPVESTKRDHVELRQQSSDALLNKVRVKKVLSPRPQTTRYEISAVGKQIMKKHNNLKSVANKIRQMYKLNH